MPVFIMIVSGVIVFGWTQHGVSTMRYALESASRQLMLNPSLTEGQVQSLVRASLAEPGDPNVTVTVQITTGSTSKIARLTGRYEHVVSVPLLDDFPITYSSTVAAALPIL
jgi:Flp pilus assembly protein TadG